LADFVLYILRLSNVCIIEVVAQGLRTKELCLGRLVTGIMGTNAARVTDVSAFCCPVKVEALPLADQSSKESLRHNFLKRKVILNSSRP
jgi:hypothetical protein